MVAITYACPNCYQHGSHNEGCPSWYETPAPDEHEVRKQGLMATAGLIAADRQERELVALVPRLIDTLDLVQKLLINQTFCERSLCAGCDSARRTVLSAVEDTLSAVKGIRE